jgi:hypothetical protein
MAKKKKQLFFMAKKKFPQNHSHMINQGHYFLFLLFHSLLRNIPFSLPGSTQSFLDMEMDGQFYRTNYTIEICSARTFFPQLFEFPETEEE